MIKEKIDKKGGWFNWLFQTFETIKVAVLCKATNVPHAFSYEQQNCFLRPLSKLKQI